MRARVLTLPFDTDLGRFADEAMRQFLSDKELVDLRDHFFTHEGQPYLAVILTYRSNGARATVTSPARRSEAGKRDAWRDLLQPDDLPLFNNLREWRSEKAKAEGVPRYVICTNRQLAEVVRSRPRDLGKLGEIEGFGRAKIHKYGAEILTHLGSAPTSSEKAPSVGTGDG